MSGPGSRQFWGDIMAEDGVAIEAQQEARSSSVGDDIKFSPFREGRVQCREQRMVAALA